MEKCNTIAMSTTKVDTKWLKESIKNERNTKSQIFKGIRSVDYYFTRGGNQSKQWKATENLKVKEDYELEYLRHLQWQHAIEMSKRYLV